MRGKFRFPGWPAVVALALAAGLAPLPSTRAETARPYLWKIEGAKKPSWIFGTIHLQRPDVANPPAAVRAALDHADAVYTEIPMDTTTILTLLPRMQLPKGKSLESILGPDLAANLARELESIHPSLGIGKVSRLRPWVAAATLLEIEDQLKYPTTLPLDLVIFQRAASAGKEVGGLETPEEQLSIFGDLTDSEQARMIADTIAQIRSIRSSGQSPSDLLAHLYLAGDLDALVAKLNEIDAAGSDPALNEKLMERLLYRRNVLMAERIAKKLRGHPEKSFFIAIGAAHLPGERGVLAALEHAGFKLSRVP